MFSSPDSMHLLESFIDQTHRHLAALATQLDRSPEAIDDVLQSLKTKVSAVLHDHLKSWEEDLQKLTEKLNLARENCMELMSCLGDDVSLCYNSHQSVPSQVAHLEKMLSGLQERYNQRAAQANVLIQLIRRQARTLQDDSIRLRTYSTRLAFDDDGRVLASRITNSTLLKLQARIAEGASRIHQKLLYLCRTIDEFWKTLTELGRDLPTDLHTGPHNSKSTVFYDSILLQYVANPLSGVADGTCPLEGVDPTADTIEYFENKLSEAKKEKIKRIYQLPQLQRDLKARWKEVQVPESYGTDFLAAHAGVTDASMEAYAQELVRVQGLQEAALRQRIACAQSEICDGWEKLRTGSDERTKFMQMQEGLSSEDLLSFLEEKLRGVTADLASKKVVLGNLETYISIIDAEDTLSMLMMNPNRLKGSGVGLLREEEYRKIIGHKPNVLRKLRVAIQDWESLHGAIFCVCGDAALLKLLDEGTVSGLKLVSKLALRSAALPALKRPFELVNPSPNLDTSFPHFLILVLDISVHGRVNTVLSGSARLSVLDYIRLGASQSLTRPTDCSKIEQQLLSSIRERSQGRRAAVLIGGLSESDVCENTVYLVRRLFREGQGLRLFGKTRQVVEILARPALSAFFDEDWKHDTLNTINPKLNGVVKTWNNTEHALRFAGNAVLVNKAIMEMLLPYVKKGAHKRIRYT